MNRDAMMENVAGRSLPTRASAVKNAIAPGNRTMTQSPRRIVRLMLQSVVVAACLAARPAVAVEARDLAGWWIAVDRLFPQLYETGVILLMEELLVIDSQARVENRFMMFVGPDAQECRDKKFLCSDAPVTALSRITIVGDQLTFSDSTKADHRIESAAELDLALRLLAVTSTASWTLSREADGHCLSCGRIS